MFDNILFEKKNKAIIILHDKLLIYLFHLQIICWDCRSSIKKDII